MTVCLYAVAPAKTIESVINANIGAGTILSIYQQIDELLNNQDLDLIIGGPPCQAYSLVGRSRDCNRMKGDERNYLYVYYAQFLKRYRPRYFLFENVIGLLSARNIDGKKYLDSMLSLFHNCGYEIEYMMLSAKDFGVLQNRKRIIIVGKRGTKWGQVLKYKI